MNPSVIEDADPFGAASGVIHDPDPFGGAAQAPKPQGTGIISNLGAGLNRAIGAPVDLATGAVNLGIRGVNAGARALGLGPQQKLSDLITNTPAPDLIPQIHNPIGGSESIERGLNAIGVPPAVAQTGGERLAGNIGESVGSMIVPGMGAEAALASKGAEALSPVARGILEALRGSGTVAPAANLARNAAIGVGAGAGQTAGNAVGGPMGGFVGSLAGGLGVGGGEAALKWAMSRPSVATQAADRFLGSASNPQAVRDTLSSGEPESRVPKSMPTTAELTNDSGLLQTQNWARNQPGPPGGPSPTAMFADRAASNNAARIKTLQDIAPSDSTLTPGQMLTDRLNKLDEAHQAIVDAATTRANETMGAVGTARPAEDVGAQARGAISANYAPGMAASQQAADAARQKLLDIAQGVGGNQAATDADTVRQQYGDQLRQFVQEGRDARAQQESRLWNAARQNGDLAFDHQPTVDAVGKAMSSINPAGGDRLTPAESQLYGTIGQWNAPQDFDTIKAMRSNIGDSADMAFRGGDRQAGRRLLMVRNGLDQSIESAVDTRVAQERAAVQAGQLDPSQTFEAALLRDRDQWAASRLSGERPGGAMAGAGQGAPAAQPLGQGAVPGAAGTAGTAPAGPAAVASDPGLAAAPGSTVDRYAAARAFTRETHQIFDQTPAGSVIARGPYGAPEKLQSSRVPGQFGNPSTQQVENARNFEAAVGGHQPAIAALQDYLAFDLKNAAWNADAGKLNPVAFQRWMTAHDGLMTIYPELKASFGNLAQAQERLTGVQQLRDQLTQRLADAMGDSNATVMGQYFRRGPAGADGVDRYLRESGNTPQARQAMADHITNDFLDRATTNGQVDPGRLAAWQRANAPALSRMPEVAAKFSDAGAAQSALSDALAAKTQAVRDFETSAARFWLRSDPVTAVTNALSKRAGNDPAQNMRDLMTMTGGDPAAQAGLKRTVIDWLMNKGVSGKAAGNTGTDYIKNQTMQDLVNDNQKALQEVFTAKELDTLDAVAADLRVSDRSISGSKAPIGPGTARDVMAGSRYGGGAPSMLRLLAGAAGRVSAVGAGSLFGGIWGGLAGHVGAEAMRGVVSGARAARENTIQDLIIGAIHDPQQARVLLTKATPQNVESLTRQLSRRMGQAATSGASQYLDQRQQQAVGASP